VTLSASVSAAMGDVGNTSVRAATRSAVALAMERWGCREDPNTWCWDHVSAAIEEFLRVSPVKYIGDAWMLAQALLGGAAIEGDTAERRAALAAERRRRYGRWEFQGGAPEAGDPFHSDAAHWQAPTSTPLFEPAPRGLGMSVSPILAHAGVVAVGHLSAYAGRTGGDWINKLLRSG